MDTNQPIEQNPRLNHLYAVLVSAVGTVFFATAIITESYLWSDFQMWLAYAFSHHWIGKSILITVVFVISILVNLAAIKIRPQATVERITDMLWKLFWFSLVGIVLITGLNIYETFLAGK